MADVIVGGAVLLVSALWLVGSLIRHWLESAASDAEADLEAVREMRAAHPDLVSEADLDRHFASLPLNEGELRAHIPDVVPDLWVRDVHHERTDR